MAIINTITAQLLFFLIPSKNDFDLADICTYHLFLKKLSLRFT